MDPTAAMEVTEEVAESNDNAEESMESDHASDESFWCKQCKLFTADGPCLLHTKVILDQLLLPRAYATLPKDLEILQKARMKGPGVFATAGIDEACLYGPLEGKMSATSENDSDFVYAMVVSEDSILYYHLDSDADCNWMKYVRLAEGSSTANTVVFQQDYKLYFVTVKQIRKGEELRVWYSAKYAKAIGKGEGWVAGTGPVGFFSQKTKVSKRKKSNLFIFTCDQCPAAFRTADLLAVHQINHGKEMDPPPTCCPDCGYTHATLQGILDHVDRHKRKLYRPKSDNQCTICPRRPCFSTPESLANHVQRVHREDDTERKFECTICKKKFVNLSGLTAHQRTHSTDTYYQCPVCLLNLPSSSEMPEHSETHRVDGQFPCGFCGKKYPEFHILRGHLSNDHGTRTWTCEICQKTFKRVSGWKRHQASHSSVYPYECETCGRKFKWKRRFEGHMLKLHNPERVHEFTERSEKVAKAFAEALLCEYCTRQYSNQERLLIHQRKKHLERLPAKLRAG